jgi:hypothetical protein
MTGRSIKGPRISLPRHTTGTGFMTRADQELLDKQFRWLSRSRGHGLLALSVTSVILVILLLGSAGIA